MEQLVIVGLGGMIGSMLRYLASVYVKNYLIFVNLFGSFLIGGLLPVGQNRMSLFLISGIIGGFTTFSAFSAETLLLLKNQNYGEALGLVFLSVVGGIFAAALGYYLCLQFFVRPVP